jgi:hypothetical protein
MSDVVGEISRGSLPSEHLWNLLARDRREEKEHA